MIYQDIQELQSKLAQLSEIRQKVFDTYQERLEIIGKINDLEKALGRNAEKFKGVLQDFETDHTFIQEKIASALNKFEHDSLYEFKAAVDDIICAYGQVELEITKATK